MAFKTTYSMSGFVATDPTLTRTEEGSARVYFRAGQEHYIRNLDGSFTQEPTTFDDVVLFRKTAEKAAAQFKKGDRFIAEGYRHQYPSTTPDGERVQREEFIARRIGHDLAYTTYTVDRTPRIQQGPSNQIETELRPADVAQLVGMVA